MTKSEYANYESQVKRFFEKEGITNLSSIDDSEPYFSSSRCECCNRPLAGERQDADGYNPTTKEIQIYRACSDCLYYAEYGQLDDMTMLDLDEEGESI